MIGFFPTNEIVQRGVTNFNANLTAADIARVQAAVQEAAIREQAKATRAQQYFQAQQMAQDRDLQRQQLSQSDYFNRGRLTNEQAQIAANLKLAESNNATQAAWRQAQLQPRIDQAAADAAADAEQKAVWATQADNLAKARNEHSSLTADLSKIVAMETAQTENAKLPNPPGALQRNELWGRYDPSAFKQEATTAGGRSLGGVNFQGAKTRLQTRLKELEDYIKSAPQGLDTMLAKTPQGWMSTLRAAAPAGTNAPPAYLNTLTNTPTNAPAAITPAKSFGQFTEGQIIYRQGVPYRVQNGQPVPMQ